MTPETIEKIAMGLRRCKSPPDLFIKFGDPYTLKDLLGIPVYNTQKIIYLNTVGDSDLELLPIWANENDDDLYNFERGYDE